MSEHRRRKVREIVLKIGGKNKRIQGVTEHTTCGDVIKMVLRKSERAKETGLAYAIFECGNNSERLLSGQARVLKTVRSWGSDSSYHFSLKAARAAEKIFRAKQEKLTKANNVINDINKSCEIENAAKLAHFVQSQKTRLQRYHSNNNMTDVYNNVAETSVDEFISNVDHQKLAGFLNFCGTVTADELVRLSGQTEESTPEEPAPGFVNGKVISKIDKINDVRYATKKVLKPKKVASGSGQSNLRVPKQHNCVNVDCKNIPAHSTPSRNDMKPNLKRHQKLADDITQKIAHLDQKKGKDVILQKYFADYICYNSPQRKPFPMPKRESGDGAEASLSVGNPDKGDGTFSTGMHSLVTPEPERHHSDSDSGQEDHDHDDDLDTAFICNSVMKRCENPPKFAHVKSISGNLVNYDITQVDKLVDYSLSDSSIVESIESSTDIAERNVFDEDEEMASFMDSKLHDDLSDEGLSSLGSEDEKYIFNV